MSSPSCEDIPSNLDGSQHVISYSVSPSFKPCQASCLCSLGLGRPRRADLLSLPPLASLPRSLRQKTTTPPPGPVFNFAAFLGVLIVPEAPVAGGFLGVIAIFLPGIMLKLAFLPLYQRWKTATKVRSVLRGLNAAAVGLVRLLFSSLLCTEEETLSPSPQ